jgi:lysophospholipase L1-like esterase
LQQVLVYSDSLSWGIVPTTRRRQPFEARWPGVMEMALSQQHYGVRVIEDCLNGRRTVWIGIPRGPIAAKFTGAAEKSQGLADAYRAIAAETQCHFFDSGSVTQASAVDGIHLDAEQHQALGQALARCVAGLPGVLTRTA